MSRITPIIISLALSIYSHSSYAQDEASGLLDVRTVTVKPNRTAEWESLQQELNAAREAAGLPGRSFWQVLVGDLDTYYIVTEIEEQGPGSPVMEPGDQAAWAARVNDCLISRSNMVLENAGGIPPTEGKEYNLAILRTRVAAPGRSDDVREWYNDRLYPALLEVGADARFLHRIIQGGNTNTWYSVSLIEDWDAFNAPGILDGNDRQVEQMFADFDELVEVASQEMLLYRADLSTD